MASYWSIGSYTGLSLVSNGWISVNMRPTFAGSCHLAVLCLLTSSLTQEERYNHNIPSVRRLSNVHYLPRSRPASRETWARCSVSCHAIEIFRDRDNTETTGTSLKQNKVTILSKSVFFIPRVIGGSGIFTHSDETGPVWRGDDLLYLW